MDKLRISCINSWGKRKNFITPINDIVPASELPSRRQNVYLPLKLYSRKEKFKLLPTFGYISDFQVFEKVFGNN